MSQPTCPNLWDSPDPRWKQGVLIGTLLIKCANVPATDDLTIVVPAGEFIKAVKENWKPTGGQSPLSEDDPPFSFDLAGKVQLGGYQPKPGRVHAALCGGGKFYSVTLRKPLHGTDQSHGVLWEAPQETHFDWKRDVDRLKMNLEAKDWQFKRKSNRLLSLCEVASIVFDKILKNDIPATGMVLITGGTGSGKTTVLNGILAQYLHGLLPSASTRRPHILAVGDPVETFFNVGVQQLPDDPASARYVDFTERTIGADVRSVKDALRDALRETTSACVVSELRSDEDFKASIDFAATGQLLFATSHSTSLVDALRKLMSFSQSEGPSSRSLLAQRLKAIVHLQPMEVEGPEGVKQVTLPSVWIGNSSGIRNFVCDGLASLLPHGEELDRTPRGTYGLAWAAQSSIFDDRPYRNELLSEAHRLDLSIRNHRREKVLKGAYDAA